MTTTEIYRNAIAGSGLNSEEVREQQRKEQYDKEQLASQEREQHLSWLQHPVTQKLLGELKSRVGINNSIINTLLNTDFTVESQIQLRSLNVKNQTIAEVISYVTTTHNNSSSSR